MTHARRPQDHALSSIVPLLALLLVAAPPATAAETKKALTVADRIAAAVEAFPDPSGKGRVGVSVVELNGSKPLVSIRQDDLFMPASNMKLLTSAFALARLSSSYQFTTKACLLGKNLCVLGSGDPTFGDPVLAGEANTTIYAEVDRWAAEIKKAAPDGVEGDILVFRAFAPGWTVRQDSFRHADWNPKQYHTWYEAPVGAVNFNNNCIDVTFQVAKGQITPVLSPHSRFWEVINRLQFRSDGDQAWSLLLSSDDSVLTLKGTIKSATDDPINVAVNNPLLLAGRVLADRLVASGVYFRGHILEGDPNLYAAADATKPICQTLTPLPLVIRRANKHSLNMAAECIFLRAGDGTWAGSAPLLVQTVEQNYGLTAASLEIHDGSGLSRKDHVSPAAMTRLLAALATGRDSKVILDSLPISGTDGTLEDRMKAAPYKGRVLAKTGYIAGASCLSGYVLDKSGKPALAFSILTNSFASPTKSLQDSICQMLVDHVGK